MSASYDWSHPRTAHGFTGYVAEGGSKVAGLVVHLAMHTPFPTTEEDRLSSNIKRIAGTVVAIAKVGFMKAPYKKPSAKPGKPAAKDKTLEARAQPLLEVDQVRRAVFARVWICGGAGLSRRVQASEGTGEVLSVRLYNFVKANSNFDRGDRDDASVSTVRVGQMLTFALTEYTFGSDGDKLVFPEGVTGVVPANTVVEVVLNPSHNGSAGYGCKFSKARALPQSLYSYMTPAALEALPRTAAEALEFSRAQGEQNPALANCLERGRSAFYCNVNPTARVVDIREDVEFVRIECPHGSGQSAAPGVAGIDVAAEDLLRFTNTPEDLTAARTLVDMAIASGSLHMLVVHDDYYNRQEPSLSTFRGVPLVDAGGFLSPVAEASLQTSDASCTFVAPWRVPHDPRLQTVAIRVGTIPRQQPEGVPPQCPDLSLVSPASRFDRGYRLYVGNPGSGTEDGEDSFYVLNLVFNAGGARAGAGGGKRAGGGDGTEFKRVRLED